MIRRPPRSTRTDTLFPTRRSSDLKSVPMTAYRRNSSPEASSTHTWLMIIWHIPFCTLERFARRLTACTLTVRDARTPRSEEHTSELQSLMRISYAVFCLKKNKDTQTTKTSQYYHEHHNKRY